ncbi:ABC1 kinase family protein [Bacillus sp. T33-2]|uniref:ABC1 kinase family protein n=1 Tax=Bacillus sp. T33-2 TaxID=2054168 RepID=UPI0015E10675|nr:AarF/ABC1/UbiB kinase family protein [Bacillus sp. T33-2]
MRRLKRYREIVSILVKYGFGYLVQEVGLVNLLSFTDRLTADLQRGNAHETASRVRSLLEELGPTFIKLGQLLSIRSDLLPREIILELEKLQDDVPPVPIEEIKQKINQELGSLPEKIFLSFNDEYVAAASIGQVHEAVLPSGEKVMVKVQRPHIKETIYADLEILGDIARLIENHYDWAQDYRVTEMVEELASSIKRELDYIEEGRNTETIKLQFEGNQGIKVPSIYWDFTTSEILTMEKIDGVKLSGSSSEIPEKEDKRKIADLLVEAFVTQILREGFFHGDPHPGNILYMPETEQLAFIDFGQVGRLSEDTRYDVTTLMIGLMKEDTGLLVKAIYRFADVPSSLDEKRFYDDVHRIRRKFSDVPLGELNVGLTINELFATAQNHRILIPTDLTMLGKTLMTVEGIISDIDPSLSLLGLAKPYGEQLFRERYDPIKIGKRLWHNARDISGTLRNIPKQVEDVLKKTSDGDLKVEIGLYDINRIFHKFDRISNQISFSITLLAFSIVVLGLIIGATLGDGTFFTRIPAVEVGFVIAFAMFLWIIYSIIRSGRF